MIECLGNWKAAAPILGVIVAAISALVAFIAFWHARKVTRRRATLDMVLKTFVDEDGQSRYAAFKIIMHRYNGDSEQLDIMGFADPNCPPSDDRQTLRAQLNEYELISLGIRKRLFDEKLYKLWFQDQFQRDYRSLEKYINKVREQRPSVFCECVWLYKRWSKIPHPENAPNRFKLVWWALLRKEDRLKAYAIANPK
ncbi:DUF4760 domain-containing protein [Croceicoccus sp. F390]|uniref:DUF4760 domain-containing protein n=1 Tax=Croceicoccus esteveae TaxID=3075597 RepID=A0ABU2ZL56_9SPHN|nr:DUF4760 domain-containing protein [Croceicoccus sp. F390]MDT0576783.1 DUF4760 domain-containing protein [Croceicoccus sp. F390]